MTQRTIRLMDTDQRTEAQKVREGLEAYAQRIQEARDELASRIAQNDHRCRPSDDFDGATE